MRKASAFILLLMFILTLISCQTMKQPGGKGALASVTIDTPTNEVEILLAAEDVFGKAGFNLMSHGPDYRLFERLGSKADALKFGGWDGTGVVMRARVTTMKMGSTYQLNCNVKAVRDAGGLEDEHPVFAAYKKEYREMLEEVKKQLEKY
jgi:hypothetical protein